MDFFNSDSYRKRVDEINSYQFRFDKTYRDYLSKSCSEEEILSMESENSLETRRKWLKSLSENLLKELESANDKMAFAAALSGIENEYDFSNLYDLMDDYIKLFNEMLIPVDRNSFREAILSVHQDLRAGDAEDTLNKAADMIFGEYYDLISLDDYPNEFRQKSDEYKLLTAMKQRGIGCDENGEVKDVSLYHAIVNHTSMLCMNFGLEDEEYTPEELAAILTQIPVDKMAKALDAVPYIDSFYFKTPTSEDLKNTKGEQKIAVSLADNLYAVVSNEHEVRCLNNTFEADKLLTRPKMQDEKGE